MTSDVSFCCQTELLRSTNNLFKDYLSLKRLLSWNYLAHHKVTNVTNNFLLRYWNSRLMNSLQDSHLNLHGEDDAPYHCRKCRYRTSIRIHLLDHFVRFHSNTRTLLCPFCLLTFNVGNQYSSSSVVTCNPFVEHMHQHRTSQCLSVFILIGYWRMTDGIGLPSL